MKNGFLSIALVFGSAFLIVRADTNSEINLSRQTQLKLGIEVEEVESREFAGSDDSVIAIPKSSVITENGKNYVFAQSETNDTRFEKW